MPENTRGPKVHPADLHLKATLAANAAGMVASGQPWQDDCAGASTTEMLELGADMHALVEEAKALPPLKAPEAAVSDVEVVVEAPAPVKPKRAKKAAQKK